MKISKNAVTLNKNARRIKGQGMTEYIIIVALIALAAITTIGLFGETVQAQFGQMALKLTGQATTASATTSATNTESAAGAGNLKTFTNDGANP